MSSKGWPGMAGGYTWINTWRGFTFSAVGREVSDRGGGATMESNVRPVEISGESLASIRVFSKLTLAERSDIAKRVKGFSYRANHQIVAHNDESNEVYLIVSGKVRVTFYALSGREVTFRDLGAGDLFGDISAIDGNSRSATVVSLADTFVGTMTAGNFWAVLNDHSEVASAVLKGLAYLVRRLSDRVVEFSTLGVNNRIHAELLRLAREHMLDENQADIRPVPTHLDMANRVSTHREAVTRELASLTHNGLIERSKGVLRVKDVPRLEKMVREVTGE